MEILRLPVLPDMRNPVAVAYPSGPSAGAVVRSPDPDSSYCNPQAAAWKRPTTGV